MASTSDLRRKLERIEADLDANRYRAGPWDAFLREALRRPQGERLALSVDVSRVSRKLHRRGVSRTLPVCVGVALEILATLVGGLVLWIGDSIRSNLAAVAAALIWITTLQPLVKLVVGWLLRIRYDYAYLWGGVEPRFKIRYGTYVAAPAWARVVFHLAGTAGSPLGAWLVAVLVQPRLPVAAAVCTALSALTLGINVLLFFAAAMGIRRIGRRRLTTSSGGSAAAELRAALTGPRSEGRVYDTDPADRNEFTESFDRAYTRFAPLYDIAVRRLPVWKTWLRSSVPHLRGPRVLEVSFGTGYLLTQFAGRFETHGVDYNAGMVETARRNMVRAGVIAHLCRANVEALPYPDQCFDTIVNTMAFSGYPDAGASLAEMRRVLRPGGRLVLIDVNYPEDENAVGMALTRLARRSGDLVRDLGRLLVGHGFAFTDRAIGGFGSVHLYIAEKDGRSPVEAGSAAPPDGGAGQCRQASTARSR